MQIKLELFFRQGINSIFDPQRFLSCEDYHMALKAWRLEKTADPRLKERLPSTASSEPLRPPPLPSVEKIGEKRESAFVFSPPPKKLPLHTSDPNNQTTSLCSKSNNSPYYGIIPTGPRSAPEISFISMPPTFALACSERAKCE